MFHGGSPLSLSLLPRRRPGTPPGRRPPYRRPSPQACPASGRPPPTHLVATVGPVTRDATDDPTPVVPAALTAAQYEAVMAPDPLLCVLAGAGAGKTRVLTLRVARRVDDGSAEEDRVLVCTFSRKAADELRRRLWSLGIRGDVRAGTFHRTALQLIRQHRADRGAPAPTVVADRRALLTAVLGEEATPSASRRDPGRSGGRRPAAVAQLEAEIGWAKARLVAPVDYVEAARHAGRRPSMAAARVTDLYRRYEEMKSHQRTLDLDDLLWTGADILEEDAAFAAAVRWRFRHLFVDEMQDVNPAQFRLLRALLGDEPDLFVVGDPNQSVYGWNGADPTLLDRLPMILEGTRVLRLDENHRCSPHVVTLATAALGLDEDRAPTSSRPEGPIPRILEHATDTHEAAFIARAVWLAHHPGWRWSHIAVLARTNAQLEPLAQALGADRIPYRFASGDLGPASDVRRDPLTGSLVPDDDAPDDEVEESDDAAPPGSSTAGSLPHRWSTSGREDPDAVVLTTFHRAKGLEWPAVFVVGLSEGLVPIASARTDAARDEERRLLYVALTRAEDELCCTWARYRDAAAEESGAAPRRASRWLEHVVSARAGLEAASAPVGHESVAEHLAELRAGLTTGPGEPS